MTQLTKEKSNQVVKNLSIINVPDEILRNINITGLVQSIHESQKQISQGKKSLEDARKAKEEGNFIGNMFYNRDEAIERAKENLAVAVGNLTSQSSRLIVFNTAISKVLLEQQNMLELQQRKLEEQADKIIQQNNEISNQQETLNKTNRELIEQQKEINKANQGLMEAKGISQEQAQKLVGIVENTRHIKKELENKFDYFTSNMENEIESLHENTDQVRNYLIELLEEQKNELNNNLIHIKNNQVSLGESVDRTLAKLENTINGITNELGKEKDNNAKINILLNKKILELENNLLLKNRTTFWLSVIDLFIIIGIIVWIIKTWLN